MKKMIKELISLMSPTEEEKNIARLRQHIIEEKWQSFCVGVLFTSVIFLIAIWVRS